MSYRKSKNNKSFTVVYNEVAQHDAMSMEARGLLLFMLSLPEDWVYNKQWLQKKCPGWGREKLAKILKELESLGFLIRTPKRSEDGKRLSGWEWEILAESSTSPESRQTRQSDKESRQNSTKPDLRVFSQSGLQSVGNTTTTKETDKQNKQTTTTEKPEFETFAFALLAVLQEMISEGGWISAGQPKPKASWLKPKAKSLYDKFHDPRPEDCAVLILKDWVKLTANSATTQPARNKPETTAAESCHLEALA